jgi:hypothetical protein
MLGCSGTDTPVCEACWIQNLGPPPSRPRVHGSRTDAVDNFLTGRGLIVGEVHLSKSRLTVYCADIETVNEHMITHRSDHTEKSDCE